jgi:hypothetical protein
VEAGMDNEFARKLFESRSIVPEEIDLYRRQTEAFQRKFGREMGPDDPFFFDPDAEEPQFRRPEDSSLAINFLADLMSQAGLDAAAIYAFKRTRGLLPVLRAFTEDELREWNNALNEYYWSLRTRGVQ